MSLSIALICVGLISSPAFFLAYRYTRPGHAANLFTLMAISGVLVFFAGLILQLSEPKPAEITDPALIKMKKIAELLEWSEEESKPIVDRLEEASAELERTTDPKREAALIKEMESLNARLGEHVVRLKQKERRLGIVMEKEILSLLTIEKPEWRVSPTGNYWLRVEEPLSITSDYYMALSYSQTIADAKQVNSDITQHEEFRSVKLERDGYYYILLFDRDSDGKIITKKEAHKFFIIVGKEWPTIQRQYKSVDPPKLSTISRPEHSRRAGFLLLN